MQQNTVVVRAGRRGWLVLGAIYLAVLTKGFRRTPPELSIEQSATTSTKSVDTVR